MYLQVQNIDVAFLLTSYGIYAYIHTPVSINTSEIKCRFFEYISNHVHGIAAKYFCTLQDNFGYNHFMLSVHRDNSFNGNEICEISLVLYRVRIST